MVQALAADEGGRRRGAPVAGTSLADERRAWPRWRTEPRLHAPRLRCMCFVSLAHPSARWSPRRSRRASSFGRVRTTPCSRRTWSASRIEALLGRVMNPRHYSARVALHLDTRHHRRWAAVGTSPWRSRPTRRRARLAIAASHASGLKENFGTMIEPLHAGMAARNGVVAAQLAARGFTGADGALDGPQGFVQALDGDSGHSKLNFAHSARAGRSWRPASPSSCTHPARRRIRRSTQSWTCAASMALAQVTSRRSRWPSTR